jgi:hypothetical protein
VQPAAPQAASPEPRSAARPPTASTTQRTRASDDGLDKPPRNMLPLYAGAVLGLLIAVIVIVMLVTR